LAELAIGGGAVEKRNTIGDDEMINSGLRLAGR
jgi:hypothetical protein